MSELKQLELKHIAPYLPYELKALQLDYKINGNGSKFGVLVGFYPLYENKKPVWHYTFDNNAIGQTAKAIKPLLRPMSELFEDIVHNGEIVCVAKVIISEAIKHGQEDWLVRNYQGDNVIVRSKTDAFMHLDYPHLLENWITEILNKFHFDWRYDLIKKGLAELIKKQQWKG